MFFYKKKSIKNTKTTVNVTFTYKKPDLIIKIEYCRYAVGDIYEIYYRNGGK